MGWFKRTKEGITTPTEEKKDSPDGLWHMCPKCKVVVNTDDHAEALWTCSNCGHHDGIDAEEYFSFLFDNGEFTELDPNMTAVDPLGFEDTKKYTDRLEATRKKNGFERRPDFRLRHPQRPARNHCLHELQVYWRFHGLRGGRENCARH